MTTKELIARVNKAMEKAWCQGNVDALDEFYDPNILYHLYPPFPELKGLDAFKRRILERRPAYSNVRFDWEEIISQRDTVATRYTMYVKHTGISPSFPIPATGKDLVLKGCVVVHLKKNKIVEQFEYDDYLGVYQQLGIVPPMGRK